VPLAGPHMLLVVLSAVRDGGRCMRLGSVGALRVEAESRRKVNKEREVIVICFFDR
jgi:hypothetical protein